MYLITGGAGFIGSNLALALIQRGDQIVICDEEKKHKENNYLNNKGIVDFITPKHLNSYLSNKNDIKAIFHLGANSSTIEKNGNLIWNQNVISTINIWKWCSENQVKLIYASSAST